jgi:hypothetical protein
MTEIWKAIPGYEGRYQVSDWGNVRSLNYYGNTGRIQNLKPSLSKQGYLQVSLYLNGKMKTFRVHVLVAMAFLKHIPDRHNKIVDHIQEGNKLNNSLKNLQITTARINTTKYRVRDLPTGVCFCKKNKKYNSHINIKKKLVYLGSFLTPEEASQAYQNKLKEITQ